MTHEQADELVQLAKHILGALGNIGDQLRRVADSLEKKPPSSKRGAK